MERRCWNGGGLWCSAVLMDSRAWVRHNSYWGCNMARVTLVAPYSKFHGKVIDSETNEGQVVMSSAKAGNIARSYVIPTNPQSTMQTLVRGHFATASAAFSALSESVSDGWNTAAALVERTNILDLPYELTGIGLFLAASMQKLLQGGSVATSAPAGTPRIAPAVTAITSATISGTDLVVVFNTSTLSAGDKVRIRLTADLGSAARKARDNEFRFISTDPADSYFTVVTPGSEQLAIPMEEIVYTGAENVGIEIRSIDATTDIPGSRAVDRKAVIAT